MKSEIDLNLLKILPLLYHHKKLKSVAKVLNKSEASVSKYLAKLREQYDDQLFFLDPHTGYEPTPLMVDILPELEVGLDHLSSTLSKRPFDPSNYCKTIVLALPQFAQYYAGHRVLQLIMEQFPSAKVQIVSWDEESPQKIMQGQVDIGFHFFNGEYPKALYQQKLGQVGFDILAPERLSSLSVEQVYQLPFILPKATGWSEGLPFDELIKGVLQHELNIVAQLDNITSVLNSVESIGGATIMTSINQDIEGFRRVPLDIPAFNIPATCAIYSNTNRYSAFHQHLISTLRPLFPFKER
jgi:DNA-binding transcriptional LysR family regulator